MAELMPEVPRTTEDDLRTVVTMLDCLDGCGLDELDVALDHGTCLVLHNRNDYPVGTLSYEDDQWWFTAHADWAAG